LTALSRDDVEKVALLARLHLTEAELDTLTMQLGQILGYVDQLAEVDTTEVEPMAHSVELGNVLAADEVVSSLPRDRALANAPRDNGRGYLVPAVLGD
jgi:aspartyl-tRNA(Asn)/glutamyl-tRNA(Gln) amidotransferase subunit C